MLLRPPEQMVAQCCAGLRLRADTGRGGTARSVPFAQRVCRGEPITAQDLAGMLAHMGAIEDAMTVRGITDEALGVAWRLWGGDPGREWAERWVYPRPEPLVAAPTPARPAPAGWVAVLNGLAAAEVALLARIHEVIEAGVDVAVAKVQAKVVNALTRPPAPLRAALGGLAHRDQVLAAMRDAPTPEQSIGGLSAPLRAALAPTIGEEDTLRALFDAHTLPRVGQLLAAHQQAAVDALARAGASEQDLVELSVQFTVDRDCAVAWLSAVLLEFTARLMSGRDPYGEQGEAPQVGRVPASIPFVLLGLAGGGDPENRGEQDYVRAGSGTVLCAGVALGASVMRMVVRLAARGVFDPEAFTAAFTVRVRRQPQVRVSTRTTWKWGGSSRPFEPHRRLDGVSWVSEDERREVCRNRESWPRTPALYPGDHRGCSCSLVTELVVEQEQPGQAAVGVEVELPVTPPVRLPDRAQTVAGVSDVGAVRTVDVPGPAGALPVELHRTEVEVANPLTPGAGRPVWRPGEQDQTVARLAEWAATGAAVALAGRLRRLVAVPKDRAGAQPVTVAVVDDPDPEARVVPVAGTAGSVEDMAAGWLAAGLPLPVWLAALLAGDDAGQ